MPDAHITTKPFTPKSSDNIAYAITSYYRQVFLSPYLLPYSGIIFGLPGLIFWRDISHGRWTAFSVMAGCQIAVWLVFIPVMCTLRVRKTKKSSSSTYSERTVVMTPEYLHVHGPAFNTKVAWLNFVKIRETKTNILLFLSAGLVHIIPKTAFSSAEDANRFPVLARQYMRSEKAGSIAIHASEVVADSLTTARSLPSVYRFGTHMIVSLAKTYGALLKVTTLVGAVVVWGIALCVDWRDVITGNWATMAVFLIGATSLYLLIIVGVSLIFAPFSWLSIRKMPSCQEPATVAISSKFLVCDSALYHTEIRWQDVLRIEKRFGQMFFFIRRTTAITVPFSAFPTKTDAHAFYFEANKRWRAAKSPAAQQGA